MSGYLGYYTISVPDLERAKAFYGRVLDWSYAPDSPGQGDDTTYAHVSGSNPAGGLYDGMERPGIRAYFVVDDIRGAVERVREMGGEATEPEESDSGWSADCADDQGTAFSLWQPAPGMLSE